MKIIFLDIDGVLNSHRTVKAYGRYGFLGFKDEYYLDPVAVKMIEHLCQTLDVKVVISSSWRLGAKLEEFKQLFDHYQVKIPVIGFTPSFHDGVRGDEIQFYLDENKDVTHYVILDDDSDMLDSQKEHFVHVDRADGLSSQNLEDCVRILT